MIENSNNIPPYYSSQPGMENTNIVTNANVQSQSTVPNASTNFPVPVPPPLSSSNLRMDTQQDNKASAHVSLSNTLTEPVWDTVKRDLSLISSNLKLVVIPNPYREDPGKALRDWDLWGPFFFLVLLGLSLSWSASIKKSEVFAVAFALLAVGAIVLTWNVLLLGGRINFFQSVSLLGYCLFPLVIGALICMFKVLFILKAFVVCVTFGWSCWAAYPFTSSAVNPKRKALALYPVMLMYISVAFFIIAID